MASESLQTVATHPSSLTGEMRQLTPGQLLVLGVTARQLGIADLLFAAVQLLLDDEDERPLWKRLEDLEDLAQETLAELENLTTVDPEAFEPPRWLRRAAAPEFHRFARRFLGPARLDRIIAAAKEDGAIMAVAVRRALRYVMPLATAADHCVGVLSAEQRAKIDGLSAITESSLLEAAVKLDSLIGHLDDVGIPIAAEAARPSELVDLPGAIGELASQLQHSITEDTQELLEEMSAVLGRKVSGARDALEHSSDPVSQAANSLIELIDRLLRSAFDSTTVMAWVQTHFPNRADLIHFVDGRSRPTKRAEALCFAHAGEPPSDEPLLQETIAATIVAARSELQRLKHADSCTDEERAELTRMLHAIEGATVLVLRIAWLGVEKDRLLDLRARLAIAA